MAETSTTKINAFRLPAELLQEILLFSDFESFSSASLTCKVWRSAALSSHIIRRQLKTVPTLTKADIEKAKLRELRSLFHRVCRQNLIGIRNSISFSGAEEKAIRGRSDIAVRSGHGSQFAQLCGMTFVVKTPTSNSHEVQLSPTIFPQAHVVWQLIGYNHTGTFCTRPSARMQAALSDCGELLAVALGQNVHIYLLEECMVARSVEGTISDKALESIQRIEFAGDGLLRLEIDGPEGLSVRYLGYAGCRCRGNLLDLRKAASGTQKLGYWKSALRQVYLDSRAIEQALGDGTSLRGMRVVDTPSRRNDDGLCSCQAEKYFFGLFRRPLCENSYAVGRVYDEGVVHITQRIPTRRPNRSEVQPAANIAQSGLPSSHALRWDRFDPENLPLAHCYDPLLAVSDDGKILVICEPPHGSAKGAVYVCSGEKACSKEEETRSSAKWPFVLSHFALNPSDHGLHYLRASHNKETGGYIVDAHTEQRRMQWKLQWA
ncbi:hypothetical protein BDW71DRAFT_215151 [Aspergillus fruticulosus]